MTAFLLFPSHLFSLEHMKEHQGKKLLMIEADDYFTRYKYHKKRQLFFIEAMRNHRDLLEKNGWEVSYVLWKKGSRFFSLLEEMMKPFSSLESFRVEERYLEKALTTFCSEKKLPYEAHHSPLFLQTEGEIKQYFSGKKRLRMQHFYEGMRKKHNILLEDGKPKGGKWSFDQENRKPLPKSQTVIPRKRIASSPRHEEVKALVEKAFSSHVGALENPWLPTTRKGALEVLDRFLEEYLFLFGPYEDAISKRDPFLFHSALSPLINIGLLTPKEVVEKILQKKGAPISSVEGFVRQVIGWREFVRGVDKEHGEKEENSNFFRHERKLTTSWYEGSTGIAILDDTIKKVLTYGYCHHIERLMVLSNIMLLAEIHPKEVFRWFMELFVDSADWVMGPNVYGMGQFSDGGLFATKPYICGSNYLVKMSDYASGDWRLTIDGLYWRFIAKKKVFFQKQPRLLMMVRLLEKMDPKRKKMLFEKAEEFLQKNTSF